MPAYSGGDGFPITLSTYQSGFSVLPSFITFDTLTNIFTIAPTSFTEIGTYKIIAKICDPLPACDYYSFDVSIFDSTIPTYSVPTVVGIFVNEGATKSFSTILPAVTTSIGGIFATADVIYGLPNFASFYMNTLLVMPPSGTTGKRYSISAEYFDGYTR